MRVYERWGKRRHSHGGSAVAGAILILGLVLFLMAVLAGGNTEKLTKIFGFG